MSSYKYEYFTRFGRQCLVDLHIVIQIKYRFFTFFCDQLLSKEPDQTCHQVNIDHVKISSCGKVDN